MNSVVLNVTCKKFKVVSKTYEARLRHSNMLCSRKRLIENIMKGQRTMLVNECETPELFSNYIMRLTKDVGAPWEENSERVRFNRRGWFR